MGVDCMRLIHHVQWKISKCRMFRGIDKSLPLMKTVGNNFIFVGAINLLSQNENSGAPFVDFRHSLTSQVIIIKWVFYFGVSSVLVVAAVVYTLINTYRTGHMNI